MLHRYAALAGSNPERDQLQTGNVPPQEPRGNRIGPELRERSQQDMVYPLANELL